MAVIPHLRDAARLLFWRKPLAPEATLSPAALVAIALLLVALDVLTQRFTTTPPFYFVVTGVNSVLADAAVTLGVVALFARIDKTGATLRHLLLICVALNVAEAAALIGAHAAAPQKYLQFAGAAIGVSLFMTLGASRRVFKLLPAVRWPTLRGVAFALCLWAAMLALPHWPVFMDRTFDASTANIWSLFARANAGAEGGDAEAIAAATERENRLIAAERAQPARLEAALAAVEPRKFGKSNVFVVSVAGWGEQQVFTREIAQSADILKQTFDIGRRFVALANNAEDYNGPPLATIPNLASALRGVGARMDPEKDVLILNLSSHGGKSGVALHLDDVVDRTLTPEALKAMLDDAGVKNRIVIVSACYSGVFVPALADERTMVITAASAETTSFGCSNERKWTYFGEAFFSRGLRERGTLAGAFETAQNLVGQWESEQKFDPSKPQIFVGEDLRRRFRALIGDGAAAAASPRPPVQSGKTAAVDAH